MRKSINVFEYSGQICEALKKGVLLTTKADDKVNTMTIGWGTIGILWNRPVFIAYVRESRYTKQILDNNGEFTVNIPLGTLDIGVTNYCGRTSGRDTDKLEVLQLTPVKGGKVSVPGIAEFPLTLECKVLYRQAQDLALLPEDILHRFYPGYSENDSGDHHIVYYGEILDAYILESE